MKLAIKLSQEPSGGFRAMCPSLPGCLARGQTKEDAIRNIHRAVEGYLASLDAIVPRDVRQEVFIV